VKLNALKNLEGGKSELEKFLATFFFFLFE